MSETPQLLAKHEENVDLADEVDVHFTAQADAHSAGTGKNDQLAKVGIGRRGCCTGRSSWRFGW